MKKILVILVSLLLVSGLFAENKIEDNSSDDFFTINDSSMEFFNERQKKFYEDFDKFSEEFDEDWEKQKKENDEIEEQANELSYKALRIMNKVFSKVEKMIDSGDLDNNE